MDHGSCGGEGALVTEKGKEREEDIGECIRSTLSQNHWMGKSEGLIFMFLQSD